ncbi:hypothetical protein QYZ87_06330 [Porphyromonadaceae bacterium W3.11]|nr:hypothetical protein [Porphyromonadaceae bacterium W3.11]
MTLTGEIGYQYSKGETFQQSQLLPFEMDVLTGQLGLSWTGSSFVSLDYSVRGNASWVKAKEMQTVSQIRELEQNFKSTILLGDAWGITANLQHYYDKNERREPLNFLFLGAGVYYSHDKYRVQVDLTNLTNIREQRFVWQNGINRGFKSTQLRGREVLITLKIKK